MPPKREREKKRGEKKRKKKEEKKRKEKISAGRPDNACGKEIKRPQSSETKSKCYCWVGVESQVLMRNSIH